MNNKLLGHDSRVVSQECLPNTASVGSAGRCGAACTRRLGTASREPRARSAPRARRARAYGRSRRRRRPASRWPRPPGVEAAGTAAARRDLVVRSAAAQLAGASAETTLHRSVRRTHHRRRASDPSTPGTPHWSSCSPSPTRSTSVRTCLSRGRPSGRPVNPRRDS